MAPKKEEVKTLDVLIKERKDEAISKIAPKIVELITVIGVRTEQGFRLNRESANFEYNELTGVIGVTVGPNAMFYANLEKKICTLYRGGSWLRTLETAYKEFVEGKNTDELKQKHEVKFRENFGIIGV